jgi:hypothetical protein
MKKKGQRRECTNASRLCQLQRMVALEQAELQAVVKVLFPFAKKSAKQYPVAEKLFASVLHALRTVMCACTCISHLSTSKRGEF